MALIRQTILTALASHTTEPISIPILRKTVKTAVSGRIWNYDGYRKMRPDLNIQDNAPTNPVYLPYEALITTYVSNLLLPGYAANVSSFAWGEIRVLPNLCVLGDAAGVAAGYCVNNGYLPRYLNDSQIQAVQNLLKSVDAKIDK